MGSLSARRKAAIVLVLSIAGLCAAPAWAENPPSILLLGISSAGRVRPDLDNVVQLRLNGLGLSVIRPTEIHVPPCESTECMSHAGATESTDLVLVGRVQKNEHACIATLWLLAERDRPPVQQDIVCLPDGTENELADLIANNVGELVESHLRVREPVTDLSRLCLLPKASDEVATVETKKGWSWKRKAVVAGLSVLLAAGIASSVGLGMAKPAKPESGIGEATAFTTVHTFSPEISIVGAISGAAAASLLLFSIR